MAPTEILAEQHAIKLASLVAAMPPEVRPAIAKLTGSLKPKDARAIKSGLADGSINIAIGTHALFSRDVDFHALGLCVIDEQHRCAAQDSLFKALRAVSLEMQAQKPSQHSIKHSALSLCSCLSPHSPCGRSYLTGLVWGLCHQLRRGATRKNGGQRLAAATCAHNDSNTHSAVACPGASW